MPRLTLPVSILLLLLFFVLLGQSYFEAKGRARRLDLLKAEVGTLGDRKAELEEELTYRQSPAYIEKEAREQLGYAFPDEMIVVLPDLEGKSATAEASEGGEALAAKISVEEISNWEQWRLLFFGY